MTDPLASVFNSSIFTRYSTQKIETLRYIITKEIKQKGFSAYLNRIDDIKHSISEVLNVHENKDFLDDNLWFNVRERDGKTLLFSREEPWCFKGLDGLHKKLGNMLGSHMQFLLSLLDKTPVLDKFIIKQDWMTDAQHVLFQTIISEYFTSRSKRMFPIYLNMDYVAQTIQRKEEEKKEEGYLKKMGAKVLNKFATSALAGSGPLVVKILQQLNNNIDDSAVLPGGIRVKEMTKEIFNNIPSMTEREENLVVNETLRRSGGEDAEMTEIWKNYNKKQLGSASIGEAHGSHYTDEKGDRVDVVVKILKPIYVYYFLCEVDFLLTEVWVKLRHAVAKNKKLGERDLLQARQMLLFLIRSGSNEFNYAQEADYTSIGQTVYLDKNLHSAKLVRSKIDPFPYIVVTRVEGVAMKDFLESVSLLSAKDKEKCVQLAYKSLSQLFFKFVYNMFWEREPRKLGFFHADLHGGNIYVTKAEDILNDRPANISVIDYGSCGRLNKSERCEILNALYKSDGFKTLQGFYDNTKVVKKKDIRKEVDWNEVKLFNRRITQEFLDVYDIFKLIEGSTKKKFTNEELDRFSGYLYFVPEFDKDVETPTSIKERQLIEINLGQPLNKTVVKERFENYVHDTYVVPKLLDKNGPVMSRFRSKNVTKVIPFIFSLDNYFKAINEMHLSNINVAIPFINLLKIVCSVPERTEVDPGDVLDYSINVEFGNVFLRFAIVASDVGRCTSNVIPLFGRGFTFMTDTIKSLKRICDNCDDVEISDATGTSGKIQAGITILKNTLGGGSCPQKTYDLAALPISLVPNTV
jgi:predicted unusual protein kinase regulating ubiquinone biosynthesis (AarF/ABC1/UbiB family)